MYDSLARLESTLSQFPTLIVTASVIAVIGGWLYTAHRNRALQRRRVAVSLLHDHMAQQKWIQAIERVREIIVSGDEYDWTALVRKRYATPSEITEDERGNINAAMTVINECEFIAVAILDKTADEKIIKETRRSWYVATHHKLSGFIDELRKAHAPEGEEKHKSMYINFESIATRWSKPTISERLGNCCTALGSWLTKKGDAIKKRVKPTSSRY